MKRIIYTNALTVLMVVLTLLLSINRVQASEVGYSNLLEQISNEIISVDETNKSLDVILDAICRTASIQYAFAQGVKPRKDKLYSLNEKSITVKNALDKLLDGSGYEYSIDDKTIVVDYKKVVAQQQDDRVEVKGRVINENGEPIIGATIIIEGTSMGAISDVNGEFIFKARKGNRLVVSYVGYSDKIVVVSETVMTIELEQNTLAVEDVIVTGYQNLSKGRATGSYDVVNKEATDMVVSTNIVDKLIGNVAGLHIDSNGDMLLRGQASLYANTKPLVVVDGFPMEYDAANINPNDIANITVLKDAASASIWGVRAANGVIVITTKQAKKNQKLSVSYSTNLKLGTKLDLASMGYMNAEESVEFGRYAYETINDPAFDLLSSSTFYDEVGHIHYDFTNGDITKDEAQKRYDALASYDNLQYIKDEFYRNSLLQQHNVAISTGGEWSTTYLSVNYENNLQDVIGNESSKMSFQFNNTIHFTKWLRATAGIRVNIGDNNIYSDNPFTETRAYTQFVDESGNYLNEYKSWSQPRKDLSVERGYVNWDYNRVEDRDQMSNRLTTHNIASNIKFDVTLPYNLTFSTSGMYIIDNGEQNVFYGKNSYYTRNLYNEFTYYDETTGRLNPYLPDGAINESIFSRSTSYTWRNTLSYALDKERFSLNMQGGTEMFSLRHLSNSYMHYGFDPQGLIYNYNIDLETLYQGVTGFNTQGQSPSKLFYTPQYSDVEDRYFSMFFTGDVTFDSKYTLFGSIRYDKTNLYGRSAEYRDQPTWSIGGRWSVSEEKFFDVKQINSLGVKASYGLSGNVDKSTSPYLIASSYLNRMTSENALNVTNPENPDLGWEKVYTTNIGVDLTMFNHRVNVTADIYNRRTEDALGYNVINMTSGFSRVFKNSASLKNSGIDLVVGAMIVDNKEVKWNSSFNFSYNKNEVTKLNSGNPTLISIHNNDPIVGQPVGYVWGYNYAGLDSEGNAQIYNADGDILPHNEVNNISINDLVFDGTFAPTHFGGWSNNIKWRGFNFDFMFTYQFGSKIRTPNNVSYGFYNNSTRVSSYFSDVWREAGDENITDVPKPNFIVSNSTSQIIYPNSTATIESGNFIRLKTIGFGYNLKRLIKTDKIADMNVKFTLENVALWAANKSGVDPQRLTLNTVAGSAIYYQGDMPTFYSLSLNINF